MSLRSRVPQGQGQSGDTAVGQAQGKSISIIVADDGNGFNVRSSKRKGIGISNMINRIESYNGKVKIKSSPGNGCKIQISISF